jgi:hypothetical protein
MVFMSDAVRIGFMVGLKEEEKKDESSGSAGNITKRQIITLDFPVKTPIFCHRIQWPCSKTEMTEDVFCMLFLLQLFTVILLQRKNKIKGPVMQQDLFDCRESCCTTYAGTTLVAQGPFLPSPISNSTFWPSLSEA